jgi:hypothetical protein
MATVENPVVENLKDSPDIATLKQMENPIVVVTKISPSGKRSANQLVVNAATGMTWQEIVGLHDQLPGGSIPKSGPGLYKFEITDQNTTAKVSWQIRLGGDVGDSPNTNEVARSPFPAGLAPAPAPTMTMQPPSRPVPPAPDAQNLGNGWVYNPSMDVLTAPNGEMFTWRKGMNLPSMTSPPVATTATSTPLSTTVFPPGSTVSTPELENMRQMLAATQAALTEAKAREQEAQRQREMRDMQDGFQKALADNNARVEKLIEALAAPKHNSELDELRRQMAEKDRIDSLRAEMKAQNDTMLRLVEANQSKGPDPVVGILTTMLADQRHSADAQIQAMRDMAAQERVAAKDMALTPERLFTMMERTAALNKDDDKADVVSKVLGGFDMLMDRMMKVTQMERDLGGGGGVNWMDLVREVGGRAGSAFQAWQQVKAREVEAATMGAHAKIAEAQAQVATARAVQHQRALAGGPAAKPAAPTGAPSAPSGKPRVTVVPLKLSDAKLSELRKVFNAEKDDVFFGDVLEYVQQLRDELGGKPPGAVSADDIAGYVIEARELIAAAAKKGPISHAGELLLAEQFTYLVERILPTTNEGLRSEIVKAIKRQLATEADEVRISSNTGKSAAPEEKPEAESEAEPVVS